MRSAVHEIRWYLPIVLIQLPLATLRNRRQLNVVVYGSRESICYRRVVVSCGVDGEKMGPDFMRLNVDFAR